MILIHRSKHLNAESLRVEIDFFVIYNCKNGDTAMFYMENNIEKDRQLHRISFYRKLA
jgi:hypothetical protein